MKKSKKALALVLAVIMSVMCCSAVAQAATANEYIPSIVIPGIFQSETKYYEDGKATNAEPPFFMDSTIENLHAEGCINAITTRNYDHFGPARVVKRGMSDDPNFPEEGITMERVYIKNVYAKNISGTVIDLEEMRKHDFIKDCHVDGVFYDGMQKIISCAEGKELPVI